MPLNLVYAVLTMYEPQTEMTALKQLWPGASLSTSVSQASACTCQTEAAQSHRCENEKYENCVSHNH